jgi:Ni/Co efflux regulator RcnB
MRNILLTALAVTALIPITAQAQSAGEVRRGQREVERGQAEVQRDVARGRMKEAREDSREVREDMRETNRDWRDYRRTHRSVYNRGAYRGPRGYRYRPVTVGYRFAPSYYSRNYWISNPGTYRLQPARRGLSWVRYGNDAVLVNLRTGRVLEVNRGFFW